VSRPGVERGARVGDGAAAVVVPVELDVQPGQAHELADHRVDLLGQRHADRIGHAQPVHQPQVGHGQVHAQQVGLAAAEGVFRAEAQDNVRRLLAHEGDHVRGQVDDLADVLAVAVLHERGRRADHDVQPVHARVERAAGVVLVAADVRQDARAQARPQHGADVGLALRRGAGRRQLDHLDAERVQQPGDLQLLRRVEGRRAELLALAERALDDVVAIKRHRPGPPR